MNIPEIIDICLQAAAEREQYLRDNAILIVICGTEREIAMQATNGILSCFIAADMVYEMRCY